MLIRSGGRLGVPLVLAPDPVLQLSAIRAAQGRFEVTSSSEDFDVWIGATEAAESLGTGSNEGWDENLRALREAVRSLALADFRGRVQRLVEPRRLVALFEGFSAILVGTIERLEPPSTQHQAILTSFRYQDVLLADDARDGKNPRDDVTNSGLRSLPYELRFRAAG